LSILGNSPDTPLPIEMVLHYIASAYVGLMDWWLEHDMPYDPDEIAKMIVQLYNMSPFTAMGLDTEAVQV
jgi:hypothetical protein